MKIELGKNWKIETDDMQFIVSQRSTIKEGRFTNPENVGKDKWEVEGYCSNITSCLNIINKKIVLQNDNLDDIMDKLADIESIAKRIDKQLRLY